MKNLNKKKGIGILAAIFLLISLTSAGYASEDFLKGKIYPIQAAETSLTKAFQKASEMFNKNGKGDLFFTGYIFQSRHNIQWGDTKGKTGSFKVLVKGDEIKIKRPSLLHQGTSFNTKEGGEPAGVVFLRKGKKGEILDTHILDLDNTYEFSEAPLYWLGTINTDTSAKFLENIFDHSGQNIQKELIFLMSTHDSQRPFEFMKQIALGKHPVKLRKEAIFWLGNYKNSRSLALLKDIYSQEKDPLLRKQVIFALYLSDQGDAVREIIRIARKDKSSVVRKQAIFWLGQKAGEESIKALKGFVEEDQDLAVKKQAVFAISRLPEKKAVPMLIDIAKTNKNPTVRKQAVFWLGQTGSEDALKFFEAILTEK